MKKFILQIIKYSIIVVILLEIVVRVFSLTNDVPQRDIDQYGLQVFKKNQEGKSHGEKWRVNDSGFLGHNDINGGNQILIIGDSFVENIMNSFDCKQSSLFKKMGFDVFEIGRSGVTFIEGLEFYSKYKSQVNPRKTIFILDNSDFEESVWEIKEFKDRTQISLTHLTISESIIKYKYLKKILYNYKTLYFLYLKHLKIQKLNPSQKQVKHRSQKSRDLILKLIDYSYENYDLENVLFVFRGSNDFKVTFNQKKISFLELNMKGEDFRFSKSDKHWNCLGHKIASEKILNYLNNL